ncbi:hypothetical protein [Actinoplanes sp. RD1]|uniref:hypothetical protein n=1 Tax=Actinoplanes sp. RD1 TaxID=3064538 RepID=UPI002742548C|nr:hypothetical protein [Actinoplanes sp. RD1]
MDFLYLALAGVGLIAVLTFATMQGKRDLRSSHDDPVRFLNERGDGGPTAGYVGFADSAGGGDGAGNSGDHHGGGWGGGDGGWGGGGDSGGGGGGGGGN